MPSEVVHLHVHTEFSLLDGQSKISKLVARAKALGMPAIAITDHGVMFGVVDFYRKAREAGIRPIIGMEGYLAPNSRFDRDPQRDKKAYHMLLLARDDAGYQNLLKLASKAQLEGYYYRPRFDRELLAKHSQGLIATTGCLAAQVARAYEERGEEEARQVLSWYLDVFGEDNFFLELQPHDIPELRAFNRWLIQYRQSGHSKLQLLATNDVHYVNAEDWDVHDTLLCIQTGALKNQPDRMKMSPQTSYYLKTADEMRREFDGVPEALIAEALENTLRVADLCHVDLDKKGYHLPNFPIPPEFPDDSAYLRHLCEMGLSWRFPNREDDPVLRERLSRELRIIAEMGFNTYFLIVWDLCEFARYADIWWNVRGSGAGSLVAYCLGITNIDPIQNSLLFERFLNPGRVSMPDIDLDYPDDRRAEMIEYAVQKYGEDKVAAIITFGTMAAKGAIRDVGRVLNVELSKISQALKYIPTEPKPKKIPEYVEADPDLKRIVEQDEELKRVFAVATELQGMVRHASTHAAGVIIADKPLDEYLPLHRITSDSDQSAIKCVTQFPMETAESIGLLKVDFLGLSTLTIMRKAAELIERHRGIRYTMDNIPYRHDDPRITNEQRAMLDQVFGMLGRGETVGVFQVESGGMQAMLRGMKPFRFEHIIAAISLYRPGPMDFIPTFNQRMHGKEEVKYLHPKLKPILEETYGIMVYQEQLMQIASDLFGYSLSEADLMRRAVSKKKQADLMKHKDIFKQRGPEFGIEEGVAEAIFDEIEFFANYGFNKSHASDYAVITMQTAFLKRHYAEEYMTALLVVQFDDLSKVSTFLEECRRLQIPVLPPDVNASQLDFDIEYLPDEKRAIRFGLRAIKNAAANALMPIIAERQQGGPFRDLTDFAQRVDLRLVGKRTLESLVRVGALSSLDARRDALLENLDRIIGFSADYHKAKEIGQKSLFGGVAEEGRLVLPNAKQPTSSREQLRWERELLGLYVSGRPTDRVKSLIEADGRFKIVQQLLDDEDDWRGKDVWIAGEIVDLRRVHTRNSEQMLILQIEDWHESSASIEVVIFPRVWRAIQSRLQSEGGKEPEVGAIIWVSGKLDTSRDSPQIIADNLGQQFDTLQAQSQYDSSSGFASLWEDQWERDNLPQAAGPAHSALIDAGSSQDVPLAPLFEDHQQPTRRHKVIVRLKRDGSERDSHLIHWLLGVFRAEPGDDQPVIVVTETNGRKRIFHLPSSIRWSEAMRRKILAHLDESQIEVHVLTP
ncbi:MAG: DNA polymerase III subunit alpha [Anaerolineae bacterium]|nr:DNA polymerase III subunit alpha [Anaerolineae bacterium]MDW8172362.1 DNA polymerase III subunit alpha [Anaerolineae bacterium]